MFRFRPGSGFLRAERPARPDTAGMNLFHRFFHLRAPALLAVAVLSGCVSLPDEPPPFTPALSQSGLARVEARNEAAFVTRVDFSTDGANRSALQAGKETPLLRLDLDNGTLRAFARGSPGWKGPVQNAPQPLAIWASALPAWRDATAGPPGEGEIHRPDYRVRYVRKNGRVREMLVVSSAGGERLTVRFAEAP